jgi:hypothetical protein
VHAAARVHCARLLRRALFGDVQALARGAVQSAGVFVRPDKGADPVPCTFTVVCVREASGVRSLVLVLTPLHLAVPPPPPPPLRDPPTPSAPTPPPHRRRARPRRPITHHHHHQPHPAMLSSLSPTPPLPPAPPPLLQPPALGADPGGDDAAVLAAAAATFSAAASAGDGSALLFSPKLVPGVMQTALATSTAESDPGVVPAWPPPLSAPAALWPPWLATRPEG